MTYVNKEFCRISKYSEDELIGKNHRILKSGFHPREFYENIWKTISSGQIWRGEIKNKAKDGTFYWVKTIIVPILDDSGKPVEYVSVRTDMTKERELQEEVTDATQRRIKAEKFSAIGQLSSRIAHDLRNPLAALRMELELIKLGKIDHKNSIQRMERSINKISFLIEDVLDFVRNKPLNIQECSIRKIIDSVLSHVDIPDIVDINIQQEDLILSCDPRYFDLLFSNLIKNSAEAINGLGHIDIKWTHEGEWVKIEISDSGNGIPSESQDRVFEPLFTTKTTGTGLGLVNVKSIVEQHGGSISFSNDPTTFTIKIPKKLKRKIEQTQTPIETCI
jgi:PAS domain S-box-containing protein